MLLMPDTDPSWTTLSSASSLTEHHSQQLQLQQQQQQTPTGQQDISRHTSSVQCENSISSRVNLQNIGVIFEFDFY